MTRKLCHLMCATLAGALLAGGCGTDPVGGDTGPLADGQTMTPDGAVVPDQGGVDGGRDTVGTPDQTGDGPPSDTPPTDGPPVDGPPTTCPDAPPASYRLAQVGDAFTRPVFVTFAPGDTTRIFVVEQRGTIQVLVNGARQADPLLDLRNTDFSGPPDDDGYSERGLLSVAFHPNFAENGRFYVNYNEGTGDVVLDEYTVGADPNQADTSTVRRLLKQEHSMYGNHNGGQLSFGPDGFLYMTLGDGGLADDPFNAAQQIDTLLGKMLRIDVDTTTGDLEYGIPSDNPFATTAGARGEIWLYGLRNPWRYHIDTEGGQMYIGDVGQDVTEEIDVTPIGQGGRNFGWSCREASTEYRTDQCPDDESQLVDPVYEYDQNQGRCSVTGGFVYRGCAVPQLNGRYFFGDYCTSEIFSFVYAGGKATDFKSHEEISGQINGGLSSFGLDGEGNLYAIDYGGGAPDNGYILRLEGTP